MIRRQVQQRKRLVCELKAVERELKAVEVFLKRLFCHNFHQILKHPHLRFRNHRDLSGTAKGGQPVSRCVTLFATVLWNLWKGTVQYMQTLTTTWELTTGTPLACARHSTNEALFHRMPVWLVGKWNLSANIINLKNAVWNIIRRRRGNMLQREDITLLDPLYFLGYTNFGNS